MSEEDLHLLRAIMTSAIMTIKARDILKSDTLGMIADDYERVAKEKGFWLEPKAEKPDP